MSSPEQGTISTWLAQLPSPTPIDPAHLVELRAELDHTAAVAVGGSTLDADRGPVRLPKGRLAQLARCERSAVAGADPERGRRADGAGAVGLLRGIALDHFVTHQLVSGRVLEPLPALAAILEAVADDESLELLGEVDPDEIGPALDELAGAVAEAWADLDPGWTPRTQSRATAVFDSGSVICSGIVDVELGGPSTGRPGVVFELKSGRPAPEHQAEAYLYALLVALRDGEAPVAVARWYPGRSPAPTPVTLGVLEAAAVRLGDSISTWVELLSGRPAQESPGAWCRWCVDKDVCPSAQAERADADGGDPW